MKRYTEGPVLRGKITMRRRLSYARAVHSPNEFLVFSEREAYAAPVYELSLGPT